MKIGDILICKNDLYKYIKGEEYRISTIFHDNTIGIHGLVFDTDESIELQGNFQSFYVYDYFYTPTEIRKLKLKSLL